MIKKIIFPLLSALMINLSADLFLAVLFSSSSKFGVPESLIVGFLLSLYVTGIFAFVGFAFPTHKVLSKNYYKIHNAKSLQISYDVLGVKYFKYLLLLFFWGAKKQRKKYFDGTREGIKNFIYQTKQSEFGHFGAMILLFLISLVFVIKAYFLLALVITGFNIIGNLYPVILQRQHRIRIGKIAARL